MAEHAGQKRAAVQFLKHGKQVNGNRAKGRETASADPAEDAHEVQGAGSNPGHDNRPTGKYGTSGCFITRNSCCASGQ